MLANQDQEKNLRVNKFSSIILIHLILEKNLFKTIHAHSFSKS